MSIFARTSHGAATRRGQTASGWLFTSPVLFLLGLFLVVPVLMALWVSFSDWNGRGSPFAAGVHFIGWKNYATVLVDGGLSEVNFGTSIRNIAWYVVLVVPIQTAVSLFLAVLVNRAVLKGRGFFRTAFYFPSVTSSVAITVLWLFLFSSTGVVNKVISYVGINGPNWFNDPRGILHMLLSALGVNSAPPVLASHTFLGISWWQWIAGPSIALSAFILMAIFTTSGTFMLLFIAALQNLSVEVTESAMVDGANGWQRFWRITLPQLRPTLFTVLTLGLIGCWEVFDQIYTSTKGGPDKTTLTPAYLSYQAAFENFQWGEGAAIGFILFAIIIFFTVFQRWALRERKVSKRRMRPFRVAQQRQEGESERAADDNSREKQR